MATPAATDYGSVDRISGLPAGIVDQILVLLPIQEAARMAVLSKFWKGMWLSLTHLNFNDGFFEKFSIEITKKRKRTDMPAGLYVINKVLLQHRGPIRKFVFHCPNVESRELRSRFDEFNRLLLFVTQNGVEEIHFGFKSREYSLPNCVFSCCTLKRLHLRQAFVEVKNASCSLPNITSLCFEDIHFDCSNLLDPADLSMLGNLPMLENLSFDGCVNIFGFNITAPKLGNLAITDCYSDHLGHFLPANLDLTSIHTLVLEAYNVQEFVDGCSGWRPQEQLPNVEYLKLSSDNKECYPFDMRSDVIDLLQMCPKLCVLDIDLKVVEVVLEEQEAMPIFSEELRAGVEKHNMLHTLKLTNFEALEFDLLFIKGLLAGLPAVEEVLITTSSNRKLESDSEIENTQKLLSYPCASEKAKIVFSPPFLPKP